MSICSVFISYAHESPQLRAQVRALANWLESNGIQVISDFQYEIRPPASGWHAWMSRSLDEAEVILVVCTPTLRARYERREVPAVGMGATFEGALITQSIYESSQQNEKVFPIIPDGGTKDDVPKTLRAYENNHFFPSGNSRILELVRMQNRHAFQPLIPAIGHPGKLQGPADNRLAPRATAIVGRQAELDVVLRFLNGHEDSAVVCANVTGSGGIGKTELCKAALKAWLTQDPARLAYYIDVPDTADEVTLVRKLGAALGIESVNHFEQLRPYLVPALYYLDNLERIAEMQEGRDILRLLRDTPGVRLLASSRVGLPGDLGRSIAIDALPLDAAVAVFTNCWTGSAPILDTQDLRDFLENDLGCHALAITLLARLGESYGLESIFNLWRQHGAAASRDVYDGVSRHGSLAVSLALTAERLKTVEGALALWTLSALFEKGVPEALVLRFEKASGISYDARQHLIRQHIWKLQEDRFRILPPIARYAFDEARSERNGFSWRNTRVHVMEYLEADAATLEPDELLARDEAALKAFLLEVDFNRIEEVNTAIKNAARHDHVANVSHEFRTPLTVLGGFVETLQTLPLSDAERARVFKLMAQQIDRMQALAADLLTIAQIENPRFDSDASWTNIDLILQAIKVEAEQLSDKNHLISFPASSGARILMRQDLLHSCISNLVVNAIRYTKSGGQITIALSRVDGGCLTVSVVDNGVGIDERHFPRIGERFYRVDGRRSRETGGTGLGLAITKELVHRIGGALKFESELGAGSTFTLAFPSERVQYGQNDG